MLPPTEGKIFSTETVSTERNLESNARVQILIVQLSNCMTPISKCLSFLNCKIRIIIIKFTLRVTVTNEFNTCNELKSALGKRPMSYFPLHYVCTLLPKLVSHTVNRSTHAHTHPDGLHALHTDCTLVPDTVAHSVRTRAHHPPRGSGIPHSAGPRHPRRRRVPRG